MVRGYDARFRDEVSRQELEVRARVIINATGVFSEQVERLDSSDQKPDHPIRISPSRGTHLVLPRSFLPTDHALMIPNTDDGRVLFLIPWLGHTLLGTTDVATDKVDHEPIASASEVDYLLDHAGRYLRQRQDARMCFRLLGRAPCWASRAARVRQSYLANMRSPFRPAADYHHRWQVDHVSKDGLGCLKLAVEKGGLKPLDYRTPVILLPPTQATSLSPTDVHPNDLQPLDHRLPISPEDIRRAVQEEMAERLEDVLSRRTRCLLLNAQASQQVADTVVRQMQQFNGRSNQWAAFQVAEFTKLSTSYQLGDGKGSSE